MAEFIIVFWWLLFSVIVGIYSDKKGGSFTSGFFISLFISPLLAGLILAVRKPMSAELERREIESGEMKKCPFCAELIKSEAIKCRYCGEDVSSALPQPSESIIESAQPDRTGWQAFLWGKKRWQ